MLLKLWRLSHEEEYQENLFLALKKIDFLYPLTLLINMDIIDFSQTFTDYKGEPYMI
jgi:hypothetical protein